MCKGRPVTDHVARVAAQWERERPDLDASPLLVLGRIERLAAVADGLLRPTFAAAGLGNGDFAVLAALRRAGAPHALRPVELATSLLVTTGAVTKRLDRLEAQGLVTREDATEDGRGKWTRLTPAGKARTDRLMTEHLEVEAGLLAGLTAEERERLAHLLGRLAVSLEPDAG
jgi:DNA-binding MarR family transcriptional regulator